MVGTNTTTFKKNVKYSIDEVKDEFIFVYGERGELAYVVNFAWLLDNKKHDFAFVARVEADTYVFLQPNINLTPMFANFKYKNKEVCVSCGNVLSVSFDGSMVETKPVDAITYSHYSVIGEYCILYFEGKRKYVVVMNGSDLLFSNFYDEVNLDGEDLYFLTRLKDSLNHGKVCAIKDKKFENYLVYLDNEEMNLKSEFCHLVFLDSLKAGNFKYCNNLLCESLKQTDEKQIASFFPEFDDYYPCSETCVILTNKNTLAGIYKFEIADCKIENIISF